VGDVLGSLQADRIEEMISRSPPDVRAAIEEAERVTSAWLADPVFRNFLSTSPFFTSPASLAATKHTTEILGMFRGMLVLKAKFGPLTIPPASMYKRALWRLCEYVKTATGEKHSAEICRLINNEPGSGATSVFENTVEQQKSLGPEQIRGELERIQKLIDRGSVPKWFLEIPSGARRAPNALR